MAQREQAMKRPARKQVVKRAGAAGGDAAEIAGGEYNIWVRIFSVC